MQAIFTITQRIGNKARGTLKWPSKNLTAAAVSGDSAHGAIPLGTWKGRLLIDNPNGPGYEDQSGNSWFLVFVDQQGRTDMGIHPDGGVPDATLGCIGLRDPDTSAWESAFRSLASPSDFSCVVVEAPGILREKDDGGLETSPAIQVPPGVPAPTPNIDAPPAGQMIATDLSAALAQSLETINSYSSGSSRLFPYGVTKIEISVTLPGSTVVKLLIEGPEKPGGASPEGTFEPMQNIVEGEVGCDTSTPTTSYVACLKGKVSFVGRYLARGSAAKILTSKEALALTGAGIKIVSIWESGRPTGSAYFTKAQGEADGTEAYQFAERIGQPKGTPIYFAVDYDASLPDANGPIAKYFDGVATGLAQAEALSSGTYDIGVYGSGRVCRLMTTGKRASWSWLAQSTGWTESGTYKDWQIKQGGENTLCDLKVDNDISSANYGGYFVTIATDFASNLSRSARKASGATSRRKD
jgi:hypothetical protein